MDDAVAGEHISGCDGCTVDPHGITDGKGEGVSTHRFGGHAVGNIGGSNAASHNVRQQNFGQSRHAIGRIKSGEVDACIGEGLVGWSKEREWPVALQRGQKISLDHRSHQRVVDACAPCCGGDVAGRVGRHEDLIDDVDEAVAGWHIGRRNRGAVDRNRGADREGQWVPVDGGCRHAVGDVGSRNSAVEHVVEENVRERCFSFGCVKRSEVNSGVGKGLVGWSKDGERPVALKGGEQFCLDHTGHQRVVYAGALCRAWDVVGCVGGREYLVDDVDDTVTGVHVGHGDVGAVDHHAITNGEGQRLAVDRFS